jgi:hypothetical protein
MPDYDSPPLTPAFLELASRMRGQPGYARTRLGRQPQFYAADREQFENLTNPLHDPTKHDYGATFMNPGDLGLLSRQSDLYAPVAAALNRGSDTKVGTTEPVSVIAPYEAPIEGRFGRKGTEPGVPLHEASHQYTRDIPVNQIVQGMSGGLKAKMAQALSKNYSGGDVPGEIVSRLIAGQFESLGLDRGEGMQARGELLFSMQKVAPEQAQRLGLYTKGHEPLTVAP